VVQNARGAQNTAAAATGVGARLGEASGHFREKQAAARTAGGNYSAVALADSVPCDEGEDRLSELRCRGAGWLDEMIRSLPAGYRDAVQLAEIEGLSQQEVADRLGLSLSGAKSRIQRGREMLKDALDRCCHFEFDSRGNMMDYEPRPDRTVCRDCGE